MKRIAILLLPILIINSVLFAEENRYENAKSYYNKALSNHDVTGYEKAIKEAQYALEDALQSKDTAKKEEMTTIIRQSRNNIDEIEDNVRQAVENEWFAIGMTEEQLIKSWGPPYKKKAAVNALGTSEDWYYIDPKTKKPTLVTLENRIVRSWALEE